ncbi:MAG TPA: 3-dehydroquinate synthase family protein [Acidimicrobiia bacterium]|nr:3-dehydroquinate synthase family protein [Acidimicrobiia bacterium]
MARLTITPTLAEQASEIIIGHGLPEPLLPPRATRERTVVLLSPGALGPAADAAARSGATDQFVLPDREEAKSLIVVNRVYEWLAELGLGRHDTILAVGGGAATDLAGFVAATWLRGIEAVFYPTTLLGAVDAAIGGKTGINFAGKNLIGSFHLPSRVLINLDLLETLPPSLRLEGLAEALKAGYVADPYLVDILASRGQDLSLGEVVERAVKVKAATVEADYRESDRRAILNFGHTVGHAVEILAPMPHGLAVAVGMVAAATVSNARFGFDHRQLIETIFGLGLPVAAAGVSLDSALEMIARDKKRSNAGVRMVLLKAPGSPVVEPVSSDLLEVGLRAVGIA